IPLPGCLSSRKGLLYIGVNTLLLLVLLLEECLRTGGDWFVPAALWVLFGLWLVLGPYVLRRVPLPEKLRARKTLLYFGVSAALLLLPLGVMCLRAGQDWFLTAALGVLL